MAIDGNWTIGHFASLLGGLLATKDMSGSITGKWRHYCPLNVTALCNLREVEDFAIDLDTVLAFRPPSDQRLMIEQDLRDQRRHIKRMAEVFAAIPDPDAPKCEGTTPSLGTFTTKAHEPWAKPVKAAKLNAKRPASKDAKPKRRGRVARR